MTTLTAGSSTTITLSTGYCIAISSGSVQSMMGPGPIANTQRILSAGGQIGPFDRSQVVYLTATADAVYTVDQPASAFMATPSQQTILQSLVSGDGKSATAFPSERVSLSSTGTACAAPCQIDRIRCTSGTSVALTVYDNPAVSSGTQLYSGTLSAGQEAALPAPVRAINGVRAAFSSGAFVFYISQEA